MGDTAYRVLELGLHANAKPSDPDHDWPLGASFADWFAKPYLGGLGWGDEKVSLVLTILLIFFVADVTVTRKDGPEETER